jgi:hypothetical protein
MSTLWTTLSARESVRVSRCGRCIALVSLSLAMTWSGRAPAFFQEQPLALLSSDEFGA